jgi:hypothetical protein
MYEALLTILQEAGWDKLSSILREFDGKTGEARTHEEADDSCALYSEPKAPHACQVPPDALQQTDGGRNVVCGPISFSQVQENSQNATDNQPGTCDSESGKPSSTVPLLCQNRRAFLGQPTSKAFTAVEVYAAQPQLHHPAGLDLWGQVFGQANSTPAGQVKSTPAHENYVTTHALQRGKFTHAAPATIHVQGDMSATLDVVDLSHASEARNYCHLRKWYPVDASGEPVGEHMSCLPCTGFFACTARPFSSHQSVSDLPSLLQSSSEQVPGGCCCWRACEVALAPLQKLFSCMGQQCMCLARRQQPGQAHSSSLSTHLVPSRVCSSEDSFHLGEAGIYVHVYREWNNSAAENCCPNGTECMSQPRINNALQRGPVEGCKLPFQLLGTTIDSHLVGPVMSHRDGLGSSDTCQSNLLGIESSQKEVEGERSNVEAHRGGLAAKAPFADNSLLSGKAVAATTPAHVTPMAPCARSDMHAPQVVPLATADSKQSSAVAHLDNMDAASASSLSAPECHRTLGKCLLLWHALYSSSAVSESRIPSPSYLHSPRHKCPVAALHSRCTVTGADKDAAVLTSQAKPGALADHRGLAGVQLSGCTTAQGADVFRSAKAALSASKGCVAFSAHMPVATCQIPWDLAEGVASAAAHVPVARQAPRAVAEGEVSGARATVETDKPAGPSTTLSPVQEFRAALKEHVQNSNQGHTRNETAQHLACLQVKAQEYAARLDMHTWQQSRKHGDDGTTRGQTTRLKASEACQEGGTRTPHTGMSGAWVVRSVVSHRRLTSFAKLLRQHAPASRPEDQYGYHFLVHLPILPFLS